MGRIDFYPDPMANIPYTTLRKTSADQVVTAATTITGLQATLLANTDYTLEYFIPFQVADITIAIGFGLLVTTATVTYLTYNVSIPAAADGVDAFYEGVGTASNDYVQALDHVATSTVYLAKIDGIIRVGGTGGTIDVRFKPESVASATVTVKTGAWARFSAG